MNWDSVIQYCIENTGLVIQWMIYIFLVIYLLFFLKPKKKASLDEVIGNGDDNAMMLTKEDRKYMKMADDKILRLMIPKVGSKSYEKTAKLFQKVSSEKYKNLTIFFVKRVYYTFLAFIAVIVVNCIPFLAYIFQQRMGVEDPQLLMLPKSLVIFSLLIPVIVYLYPELEIKGELKKRDITLKKEVISLGILVHTMLETGNSPYDILQAIKEIKPAYKGYIEIAMNEYYVNTKAALENLKKRVGIPEFDMIVESLIFAYETDNNYASRFLNEYITRLEQTTRISSEKSNKIKPYILLVASIPPLISALIIWFYPWILQATESLTKGLNIGGM